MKQKLSQHGFSLIEAVLYLAIVAILLTAVLNFHITMGNTSSKLSSNIDVSRNRRLSLMAIDYLVKNADGFLRDTQGNCSDFSSSPEVLALYFEDDTYLPGTCVQNGGGVLISLDSRRIKLTCHPNILINGTHKACDSSTYPAGNSYYLTSPDVVVLDSDLAFATSTATTTTNYFTSLTTNLSVGILSQGQTSLSATSTATSTVVMRNEDLSGLVGWWKFDDASGTAAVDSSGRGHDLSCSGTPDAVTGLVDGSSGAFDFNKAENDRCTMNTHDDFNFEGGFTLSAWLQLDNAGDGQQNFLYKGSWGSYTGYVWTVSKSAGNGRMWLRIFTGDSYSNVADTSSYIVADGNTTLTTFVYDLDNDQGISYIFDSVTGATVTTTDSVVPIMVNYHDYGFVLGYIDSILDEVRVYNRALTEDEVIALQSQGKY